MKRIIALIIAVSSLFLLSSCQESTADQAKRLKKEAEEKRQIYEQKKKEADDLENTLKIITGK